jgi:hypothetical protein
MLPGAEPPRIVPHDAWFGRIRFTPPPLIRGTTVMKPQSPWQQGAQHRTTTLSRQVWLQRSAVPYQEEMRNYTNLAFRTGISVIAGIDLPKACLAHI